MALIVIQNDQLDGARAVIDTDALTTHEARGWVAVGPTSDRSRDPIRTDAEQAEHDAEEAARIAALLDVPVPDTDPAVEPKPRPKRVASK